MTDSLITKLRDEAHLWSVRPESITCKNTIAACLNVLSDHEKQRHGRFRFARDRHRFLVSHAMVRNVLSKYAPVIPEAWQFSLTAQGKPEVVNPGLSGIRFNLSHCEGLAACLVTANSDCGVDVERIQMRHNPTGVAQRMFSSEEYQHMKCLQGRDQLLYFFQRWTLREAYTKARGIGIAFPTHKTRFSVRSASEIAIEFEQDVDDRPQDWQFELFPYDDELIAAVAIRRSGELDKTIIQFELADDVATSVGDTKDITGSDS